MNGSPIRSAVVVGGGITGLTLAFHLQRRGVEVRLVEAASRWGGVISTDVDGPWIFEFGPNTVTTADPAVERLIREAGLTGRMLVASTAGARRFIVKNGRLALLPGSPPEFLGTSLFSLGAKLRLAAEPFIRPSRAEDETVADFVRRRLGREMLDYAVGPFVSGVYAGDPEKLSVRHAVAKVYALEQKHGSLIRGAMALKKERGGRMSTGPAGGLLSFQGGLKALPEGLAARLGERARLKVVAESLARSNEGWTLNVRGADGRTEALTGDVVVLACEATATRDLLRPLDPENVTGIHALDQIPSAGVSVTALGFKRGDIAHPLDGFGFLAPRVEKVRLLGTLFPSSLFPGRAPDGHVALTAILGGATDPGVVQFSDEETLTALLKDLTPLIGVRGRPVYVKTVKWARAIPQYNLGHGRFVAAARAVEERFTGLHLLGNWREGVSVGDRIGRATRLAEALAGGPGA